MSSTPADCVRFGVLGLGKKFDLVLSGINYGVNLGADIVYSGTVGAIFEAARMHIPAIAFSSLPDGQEIAAKYLDEVYAYITENKLFDECPLFNVNIPNQSKGIRMTYQGSPYFSDRFIHRDGDIYVQEGEPIADVCPEDLDRDTVALVNGYISVTPLLATRTDMSVFEKYRTKTK
jgi:5'-nucleotidase